MWCLQLITLIFYFTSMLKVSHHQKYQKSSVIINEEDEVVFKKYAEIDKQFKDIANYGVKKALPLLMEASENLNLSSKCVSNFLHLTTGIRKLKLSAITFLDASGKPGGGILNGNIHMLGDYDQCLNAAMEQRNGHIAFRGQYCLIYYRPLLPSKKRPVTFHGGIEELVDATTNASEVVRFIVSRAQMFYYNPSKYGVCVPSGCSKKDMEQIVKYVGEQINVNTSLISCDADDDTFFTLENISYIAVFALIGFFVLVGTIVEYYSWKKKKIQNYFIANFFMCFSVLTNFPKVISTERSENNISCLNGVRALNLFYLILLHQYYAVVRYYISSHTALSLEEIPQFFFQIVANGFLTADVYFFMGGLVNCYTRMQLKETEKRKTNLLYILIHRYTRVIKNVFFLYQYVTGPLKALLSETSQENLSQSMFFIWPKIGPPYMFFSFLMALFRPYGPMRLFQKQAYAEKCQKHWWQNTLFINNFFYQDDTCLPHTWYVAADMQLFLISLITVPVFFKCARQGIILNTAVVIFGMGFTVIWSTVHKLTPGVVFYRPNEDEIHSAWNAHTSTFPHIAPYFTGILMGYFLSVKKNIKISGICQFFGWPFAAFLFISMLFVTKIWNSGVEFTVVDIAFYFGFSKFLFVVSIAWMILCCTSGYGGIINYILSLPLWIPISRISFVVYLIAPFLQGFYFANSRIVVDGHRMALIWRFAGDTLISCVLGLVLVVLIELPFVALEKLLFYRPVQENVFKKPVNSNINNELREGKKDCNREKELNDKKEVYRSRNVL